MARPLNILIAEDSPDDADLIVAQLHHDGFEVQWQRVETEADFLNGIKKQPDLILSDYSMPQFSGLRAAQLTQKSGLDIPFILISGTVGEEAAVQAMKHGAYDYLLKDRLARLGQAVTHALKEAEELSRRKKAEQQILIQTRALEAAANAILITDRKGNILLANSACCAMTGYAPEEMFGRNPRMLGCGQQGAGFFRNLWETILAGQVWRGEMANRRKDCTIYHEESTITPVRATGGEITHFIAVKQDITERKHAAAVLQKISRQETGRKKSRIIRDLIFIVALGGAAIVLAHFTNAFQAPIDSLIAKLHEQKHPNMLLAGLATLFFGFLFVSWRRWRETQSQVSEQAGVQIALQKLHDELEKRVLQRTAELSRTNDALRIEITERQRAQETLRESEEKYRRIFENVQDVFYQTDTEGKLIEISPSIEGHSGYLREELLGQAVEKVYQHPQDRARLLKILQEQGEVVDYELQLKTKSGRLVHTSVNAHIQRNSAGRPIGVEGVLRDITRRKLAEEELLWKSAFLEAQVNSALDAVLVVNRDGKRIFHNRQLLQLFKIPEGIAQSDDDAKWLEHVLQQVKSREVFAKRVAYLYAHPDEIGRDEIELVNGTILDRYSAPVLDTSGKYYGRIWNFRDITEHRKLEEQFRQSQKMEAIGHLAGGVAHDFNNILAVIQMQAGLLRMDRNLSPDQMDFAGEIEKAAQRGANLTRQLLLFSRRQAMHMGDIDLNDIVTNITKMLQRILGENIQMQFNLASAPLFVHADPGMMDQVLMNLAVNCRDAMPAGGRLIIETATVDFDSFAATKFAEMRPGSYVSLSVSDTGSGIPPEVLPRIFEPFFTTKEVGKGTGLGLATVFGIIQQHQGWINVHSKVGHGTTMRVYLPRLAGTTDRSDAGPSPAPIRGGNETILLVEDEPTLRKSTHTALSRLGYHVLEAASAAEAITVWNRHQPEIQLLLTDLVMPGKMTGKDLARRLLKETPLLKVIYVSGYSAEIADRDFPLEEGVNFLNKPFPTSQLAKVLRDNLDARS